MTASPSSSSIYTDFSALTQLQADVRHDGQSPEAIEEVARQFEAIFTQMMLKSMRDAGSGEGGLFDNDQSRMYREMFDKQVSLSLAEGRGIGLKEILIRQLGGADEIVEGRASINAIPLPTPTAIRNGHRAARIESPEAFVAMMRPEAEKAAEKLGVAPEVLISQSALETGWGKAIIQDPAGNNSFNLFGIKADTRWSGPRVAVPTIEYENGVATRKFEMFRAYQSYAESFEDYVDFIKSSPRYENALLVAAEPRQYLASLQQAGYATDPEYAIKINKIMDSNVIREESKPVQDRGFQPLI